MENPFLFDHASPVRAAALLPIGVASVTQEHSAGPRAVDSVSPRPAMTFLNDEVYAQLHGVAVSILASQELRATMSAGDLLHDALLRLSGSAKPILCFDLHHFKALVVRLIKRALLDHLRRSRTRKWSEGWQVVPLESVVLESREFHREMFEVREALQNFARFNKRAGIVLSKRVFQEARIHEIANELTVSVRTVKRDLRVARRRIYPEPSNHRQNKRAS
jgi:RNA polymerase sigma factor (sigma-70 family)